MEKDLEQDLPIRIVAADRAYDDGNNHYLLEHHGLHSAIHLNDYRTQKKDKNKQVWLKLEASETHQQGLAERYKIERKFGEAKQNHGLARCRSLGLLGYGLQAFLTAIALNLKRIVKLVTGTPFKAPVRAVT